MKKKFSELPYGTIFSINEHGSHLNVKANIPQSEANAVSLVDGRVRTFAPTELVYEQPKKKMK